MKDMLNRDFTIGDQVAHVIRGSSRVHAVIGIVRSLNVVDYTVVLEIVHSKDKKEIGRLSSPMKEHNVLLMGEVD